MGVGPFPKAVRFGSVIARRPTMAIFLPPKLIKSIRCMRRCLKLSLFACFRKTVLLSCSAILAWCQTAAPKIFDCHVHHNGSEEFLKRLINKLQTLEGMALLITAPKDLDQVKAFMNAHPGRLVGLGEIDLDSPDALGMVDRFHNAGFRGLGELTKPHYSYDDRRYWPIYHRAEQYRMVVLFHTGIVNRTNPDVALDSSSDRMRVSTLDLIAREFPN